MNKCRIVSILEKVNNFKAKRSISNLLLTILVISLLFVLILTSCKNSTVVDVNPWPMFHHDLQHTGLSSYDTSENNGTLKWKYQTGDLTPCKYTLPTFPTVGSDGTIYSGALDSYIYALNPDGILKWRYETGGPVWSSPAISPNGTIYFGSEDNYIYAVNPDGTLKWKFKTGSSVTSSPSIGSDGTIYVGSDDNYLYALNSDGTLKWR
jgi:outer membrane protein assembly factor BamB